MHKLYHYCGSASFDGIVGSKTIWLSTLVGTNDPFEIEETINVIGGEIEATIKGGDPDFSNQVKSSMDQWGNTFFGFGLSCCATSDNNRLWSDYGKKDTGFCLEIDTGFLQKRLGFSCCSDNRLLPQRGACICPIEYADQNVIDDFVVAFRSMSDPVLDNTIIQKSLICPACFIKPVNKKKWEDEKEIRIAVYGIRYYPERKDQGEPIDKIREICQKSGLSYLGRFSPHLEVPLIPGLVTKVICGRKCTYGYDNVLNKVRLAFGDIPVVLKR